jgi:hypothetical protein
MAKKRLAAFTPEFRLSYPNLFEPREQDDGRLKFSMDMLFDKDGFDKEEFDELKKVFNAAVPKEWIANSYEYVTFWKMFINGDKKRDGQGNLKEELKGQYVLRASCQENYPPRLLLPSMKKATRSDIYGGCFCKALLTAYSWEHKNKKGAIIKRGVSFSIEDVIKTRDGDPFGGGLSASDRDEYYKKYKPVEVSDEDADELEDELD